MRTKRKNYDYQSSDDGNEDYGQEEYEEDVEEDEQLEESEADSDYGASHQEGVPRNPEKHRPSRKQVGNEIEEQEEESYEDEDPFSPEIDQILADKQEELSPQQLQQQQNYTAAQQIQGQPKNARNQIQPKLQQQTTVNLYLIKFQDLSYLHCRWMEENELEQYSYRAKQKIRRYWIQKQKKKQLQDYLSGQKLNLKQKNHHFSEDEEDEELDEAALKVIALADIPIVAEGLEIKEKPKLIEVLDSNGEDLTQYFDKNYIMVERILSTSMIFPVVHPRQARSIRGKWQEDCLKVVNVLVNFRKNNVCIGLSFAEQLDPENEDLADYFKVIKTPIDFIMIQNRLYNKYYQQPTDFWNDLGLVFKNCRQYQTNPKLSLRKQCDALRVLAYHLYKDWYNEQKTRFTTGIALPPQVQTDQISKQNNLQGKNNQIIMGAPSARGTQPPKDSTYVNLQSLLQSQQNLQNQVQPSQNPQQQQQPINPPALNQSSGQNNQSNEFWNALQRNQNDQNFNSSQQMMGSQNNPIQGFLPNQQQNQQGFQPPSLPKFNQILSNPMQGPNGQQINFNDPFFNQKNFNQNIMLAGSGLGQNLGIDPQQQMFQNQWGNQNQPGDQNNLMKLFGSQNQMQDPNNFQLPSLQQFQQNLLQNPFTMQQNQNAMLGMSNPFGGPQLMDMSTLGQIQRGVNPMIGQGGAQDFSQLGSGMGGMLPSLSSLQGNNQLGLQLPSMNQFGQGIGQGFMGGQGNPFDQFGNLQAQNMMNMLQQNQQLQQQMQLESLGFGSQFNPSGMNGMNPNMDEYQQLLRQTQGQLPGMNSFNFGTFSSLNGNPYPDMMGGGSFVNPTQFNNFNQLSLGQNQTQATSLNQSMVPYSNVNTQNIPNSINPMTQQITTQQQVESLIQPDLNDNYNDKQEPPVPPAIIDPGEFGLEWILDKFDILEDLQNNFSLLTEEEIKTSVRNKSNIDQIYLVKWRSLSYTQSTWEPESVFKDIYEDRIQDYFRYNRSLDQLQREKLDNLIKNNKKMLRITEKKYQNAKKQDQNQENFVSLQEAKINRQLLNIKIQEMMGQGFHQIVQYSEKKGFVPQFKKPIFKLKDYQILGLNWLIRAWHDHRNVVLADEMGLGKTIMTLSLFDHLNKVYKLRGPFLILAPLTTLEHWKRIADEWTSLNSILYYDPNSSEGRQEIRQWEWYFTDITYKGTITQKSELYKFNIIITSFEVFVQDLNPILQEIPFMYIVVDEAHRLKNKQAKTLKLLKDHPCKRILLLTGTPVQNNTKELWTLLNYIEPEKFYSLEQFLEEFGNLESYEQITKLHSILKPHFLRRLKEEVDNSIPPLQETVIEVGLTSLQSAYYKGIYGENRMILSRFGTNSIKTSQLNNIDVQLRKCCNHLFLLKGVEEELTKDCKNEEDLYKKLLECSGKLMLLNKFIDKFRQENHKVLIFSQFKRMLDIIELYLRMKGVAYEMLTGSVKTQDRISAIQRFNEEKTFGVFLLTTRAGGLGINLTSARVVIIFDSDWNPQNDLQAIARAHRIGQKFEVQVYRLITSKTYEEQMFERASKKLGMEQALFSKGAFNQDDDPDLAKLTLRGIAELKHDSKEIENLLKYGTYAFVDQDGGPDQDGQFNKDIDEILATGKKKEFSYNKGIYTLQKSTFNALKYEKLPDVNDPDFWNKVLPFESIISISVLEKRFKKEKREMQTNEKMQKEFIKDLEIVFNDFIDAKFDTKTSNASKKQFESDEEKLREVLKKIAKMNGFKLLYQEKCKEWLREMFKTNKRKKNVVIKPQIDQTDQDFLEPDDEDDPEALIEDDDIIMYDSDEGGGPSGKNRNLRKRNQIKEQPTSQKLEGGQQPVKGKRGRKPANWGRGGAQVQQDSDVRQNLQKKKKKVGQDESEYEEEFEGEVGPEGAQKRVPKQQDDEYDQEYGEEGGAEAQNYEDEQDDEEINEDDDDDEVESRYSLRGRTKRQKTGRDENYVQPGNYISAVHGQGHGQKLNQQYMPKMNDQIVKRNEKNGIVCSFCLKPEPPFCAWFCQGYCQRFFHDQCKDKLFGQVDQSNGHKKQNEGWICDDCKDNKAICYCCKQRSKIQIIPKKGKPRTPGQLDEDEEIVEENKIGEDLDEEDIDEDYSDDYDDLEQDLQMENYPHLLDEEEKIQRQLDQPICQTIEQGEIEGILKPSSEDKIADQQEQNLDEESPSANQISLETSNNQEILAQSSSPEIKIESLEQNEVKLHSASQKDSQSQETKNESKPQVLEEGEIQETDILKLPEESPQIVQVQSTKIVLAISKEPPSLQAQKKEEPVVRCTLGGCFKYYHVSCVYKNKNVSCINSMKVQRFRCPLHYCEICQASGDSVLIVQCVNCPTAYHLKCLPKDEAAIRLTKKYIICGKHGLNQIDFPKYEEKTSYGTVSNAKQQQQYANTQGASMSATGITIGQKQQLKEKRKKKLKKRGRKPKQQADDEEYGPELSPIKKQINQVGGSTNQVNAIGPKGSITLGQSHSFNRQQQSFMSENDKNNQSLMSNSNRSDKYRPLFYVTKHPRQ